MALSNWQQFWNMGGNIKDQRARGRADYERRQQGQGERPWWIGLEDWQQRGDRTAARNQFTQAEEDFNTWKNEFDLAGRQEANQGRLNDLDAWRSTNQPTYTPLNWSDFQGRYQGYQNSLDSLLSRIGAGPTTDDENAAFEQMARLYGMTPEQFRQMQTAAYGTTAEDINQRAESMAFDPNSEANKSFEAAIRSQQRAAEAGMGKQLETIFADRGGLGGFAAAQDYTLQMSDQMLQQRSQFMLDRMQQSVEMINQDVNRKIAIVQAGQGDAKQFLNERWANLQQTFQNTAAMANQVLQEYATRSDVNQGDFQANLAAFTASFDAQKDIILTQMGIDQATMDQYEQIYNMSIQPYLDMWATSA